MSLIRAIVTPLVSLALTVAASATPRHNKRPLHNLLPRRP